MSESESGQEKTEQPSEKRLREARERGQVPRSREVATALVLLFGTVACITLGSFMVSAAGDWLKSALTFQSAQAGDGRYLLSRFFSLFGALLLVCSPLILLPLLAAVVSPLLLGGFNFSSKAFAPDFNRLNPVTTLGRMWGMDGFAELVKTLLRVLILGAIGLSAIWQALPHLIGLMGQALPVALSNGAGEVLHIMLLMTGGLVLIGGMDAIYQIWHHRKQLMMTRQELIDEMKETEGRPEIKSKIRRMQRELAQRAMMESVPTADVILVNPTHYAVALKYEAGRMRAPRLVAKGVDEIAMIIRQTAEKNAVPIVTAPPLARRLYRQVEIGHEIPAALYAVVAQILGYVYQLSHWRRYGGKMPPLPDVNIPEE